jgi:hypothetical protein
MQPTDITVLQVMHPQQNTDDVYKRDQLQTREHMQNKMWQLQQLRSGTLKASNAWLCSGNSNTACKTRHLLHMACKQQHLIARARSPTPIC